MNAIILRKVFRPDEADRDVEFEHVVLDIQIKVK